MIAQACVAPDCDNQDCGSCANACCKLSFSFPPSMASSDIASVLNDTIKGGGPDGRYFETTLAEGVQNVADLHPLGVPLYIAKTIHTTSKRIYNDSIDMTITDSDKGAVLRAFSISQIGGAYCDAGQNFKNIVTLMKPVYAKLGINFSYSHVDESCPQPSISID
mmetsp:Transcript_19173/g.38774  ORF Transcript_19173/g.38774 Transcript_19173/m.38774 type:complete len:164 (-) Transcript_19173:225-716(-)